MGSIIFFSIVVVILLIVIIMGAWANESTPVIICSVVLFIAIVGLALSPLEYMAERIPTFHQQLAEYDLQQAEQKVLELQEALEND